MVSTTPMSKRIRSSFCRMASRLKVCDMGVARCLCLLGLMAPLRRRRRDQRRERSKTAWVRGYRRKGQTCGDRRDGENSKVTRKSATPMIRKYPRRRSHLPRTHPSTATSSVALSSSRSPHPLGRLKWPWGRAFLYLRMGMR